VTAADAAAGAVRELVVSGTLTLDTTERAGVVYEDIPGGSALYGAAAGSLLLPTRIVGTVGDDFPFETLRELWERAIDRTMIEVVHGPTFRWHARYEPGGDRRVTLSRDPGVAAGRLPVVPPMPDPNYALLLGSTDPRVQAHVRDACTGARLVGLDSMTHWWKERPDAMHALLARVDIVFVDEAELALATGTADPAVGASRLLGLGPQVVVVKRGSRGAWMKRRDREPIHTPAVHLSSVVDTTGAGDAFAGACIAALAHAPALGDEHALRFATAIASFAVEGVGTTALARADLDAARRRMDALGVFAA
jgi:sugar/nucleoside kinase (ribokinase family)